MQLRANQAMQEHPEWSQYIQQDVNGMIQIVPPGVGMFGRQTGPPPEMYRQMLDYMKGQPEASHTQQNVTNTQQNVIKQYSPSRNQTRISNDGGKTWTVLEGRQ